MYHHHHNQQQGPQPFSTGPRPPHHQPPPNQNQPSSNMLSQVMGFPFPRPTQLPDELESALAIRGARDMDHRLIDHMNRPNQHQNQGSGSGISQHGSYGSNQVALTSDNQPGHQQGVDWSSYQPPTKLFSGSLPGASHQSRRQGPQQPPQSSHAGTSIPNWTAPVTDSPSVQGRHPHGGGSGSGGDGQTLYTPESAGSILASFGLSNEDLEVLSHYPDDQLTPDTLPFILRDIQINKTGSQKPASTSSSSFSRGVHDMPPAPLKRSHSPEVPSLLTVTQTAGKVIDYGHASRAKDESNTTRETFKREQLSNERTVKMYPSSSPSSSAPILDKVGRRHVRLEHIESSKHGDQDYRRTSTDHRKSIRSPGGEFPPTTKSRNLDRDYRRDGPKSRPPSETKSEASSRRSLSSSSGSNPHHSSKKLPTPTMISDFSAMSPKVYPHTCSLCHTQCDQEKDWIEHINTVDHTAACRDLRNKYPAWKPNLPSRSGRYGSRALWDPKTDSLSHSLSGSPTPSPPHSKHRGGFHHHRPYHPHHQPRHQHYIGHSHRLEHSPSGSPRRSSSREHRLEKRDREPLGGSSRSGVKRPHDDFTKFPTDKSRHSSSSKAAFSSKHGLSQQSTKTIKSGTKPGTKTTKMSAKPPPAKKKKKVVTPTSQDMSVADRLVYLTGIPKDASEQEVTDLVGSFGKINNVILMPCSEEEKETGEGQKASVCMMKAEDAQTLANTPNLSIRDKQITALVAKVESRDTLSSDANNSKPAPGQDKGVAGGDTGSEVDQKTSDEKGLVLITGFPESGWSESDIINLVQPFGPPADIILATQVGKVLVSMSDMEIAQEMVKVNAFTPAKVQDSELKMINVKQHVGLHTPVALYNLLMGSVDPLQESCVPVSWSSLVVINNVPNTQTGSSEVQKLMRRFGTVIKTLVLNNTVICEMATPAMALSVYKRFQTFPCIIHNNPLLFSRKPDPKVPTQTKVTTTYLDSFEDTSANGSGSQATAAAETKDTAHKENSQSPREGIEKEDGTEKRMMSTEKTVGEDEALGGNVSKDELTVSSLAAPEADMDTDTREKPAVEMNTEEKPAVETITEEKPAVETITEEKTAVETITDEKPAVEMITEEKPAVDKETKEKPAVETITDEKPAVEMDTGETQAVDKDTEEKPAVETITAEKPAVETDTGEKPAVEMDIMDKPAVETNTEEKPAVKTDSGEKPAVETDTGEKPPVETDSGETPAVKTVVEKAVDNKDVNQSMAGNDKTPAGEESAMPALPKVTQEMVNALLVECRTRTASQPDNTASTNGEQEPREAEQGENAVKETKEPAKNHTQQEVKKQERERKEREARKEKEARERKERERKAWEKEERTKRERERSERTRRERERREEERRERERRDRKRPYSEGFSGSRWSSRSEGYKSSSWRDEPHNNPEVETNTDEADEESDFPFNLSDFVTVDEVGDVADLPVPMETTEQREDVPTSVQQDTALDTPLEVTTETTPDVSESDPVTVSTTENLDVAVSSDLKVMAAASLSEDSQGLSSSGQTAVTACEPETTETEAAQKADQETTSELITPPAAPANSSNSPTTGEETSERDNQEKEDNVVNPSQPKEQETLDNTEQQEKMQEEKDKETETPAVETGKPESSEDQTNTKEENVEKKLKTAEPVSSDSSLPPFDPTNPVGLEFLVPKTGFFCKVCNRFFSGNKEAERNHCKTLKHYENLKKYLQTTKPVTVKPDST